MKKAEIKKVENLLTRLYKDVCTLNYLAYKSEDDEEEEMTYRFRQSVSDTLEFMERMESKLTELDKRYGEGLYE